MQSKGVIKSMCHCCKQTFSSDFIVSCKTECCGRIFCHKCLTSRYKYSRAKVSRLPTPNWRCPVCTNRCQCDVCVKAGVAISLKKKVIRRKNEICLIRKKKRKRKSKETFTVQMNSGTRTPLSEKETNESSSLVVHNSIPSISGTYLLSIHIVFLKIWSETKPQLNVEQAFLPVSLYEKMSVNELLKIASQPIY